MDYHFFPPLYTSHKETNKQRYPAPTKKGTEHDKRELSLDVLNTQITVQECDRKNKSNRFSDTNFPTFTFPDTCTSIRILEKTLTDMQYCDKMAFVQVFLDT